MNRALVPIGPMLMLLGGCALFNGHSVPPAPATSGIKAQNAALENDIQPARHGGAPHFRPLSRARRAVKAAAGQPHVAQYDANDLARARQLLAKAETGWNSMAGRKSRSMDKLADVASTAHRAQRLAEIARYTARREIDLGRLATTQSSSSGRQDTARNSGANVPSDQLIGRRVIPDRFGRISFHEGTARIDDGSRQAIDQLAKLLRSHSDYAVAIFGFTGSAAPPDKVLKAFVNSNPKLKKQARTHAEQVKAYHYALSSARARDVAILLTRAGISAHRIGARGFGSQHPQRAGTNGPAGRRSASIEAVIMHVPDDNSRK